MMLVAHFLDSAESPELMPNLLENQLATPDAQDWTTLWEAWISFI